MFKLGYSCLVSFLLAAGAAAVWFAPSITAGDIGSLTTAKKLEAIDTARNKNADRMKLLANDWARDTCRKALQSFLLLAGRSLQFRINYLQPS
jgi:hypothetical protein